MDYEASVIEFLAQGENFPFVLEIAERIEEVKVKLRLDFWKRVKRNLTEKLNNSPHQKDWIIWIDDDISSEWTGINLYPTPTPQTLHLGFKLEQWIGDLHPFYGVRWSREHHQPTFTIEILNNFVEKLQREGYTDQNTWWPAFKHTNLQPRSNDFLLRVAKSPESFTSDVSDMLWELFVNNADTIQAINRAIAANEGRP